MKSTWPEILCREVPWPHDIAAIYVGDQFCVFNFCGPKHFTQWNSDKLVRSPANNSRKAVCKPLNTLFSWSFHVWNTKKQRGHYWRRDLVWWISQLKSCLQLNWNCSIHLVTKTPRTNESFHLSLVLYMTRSLHGNSHTTNRTPGSGEDVLSVSLEWKDGKDHRLCIGLFRHVIFRPLSFLELRRQVNYQSADGG